MNCRERYDESPGSPSCRHSRLSPSGCGPAAAGSRRTADLLAVIPGGGHSALAVLPVLFLQRPPHNCLPPAESRRTGIVRIPDL